MERWLEELGADRPEAAWDAFLGRYRALLFAAIRHYVRDHDDVMDVFTWVCEALRKDDFHRLKSYGAEPAVRARFTTWLVAVVRNLTVDWLRRRNGRARPARVDDGLSELQRRIRDEIFGRGRSHTETYERIRSRDQAELTFGQFLKELPAVYRAVERRGRLAVELSPPSVDVTDVDLAFLTDGDARRLLERPLAGLSAEDRVAVEMYVIDEVPAADVARVLGLANAKAVYNRVYRALTAVRGSLERAGLRREDL